MDYQDAYMAARDARAAVALELASCAAYGVGVNRADALAIAYRAAHDAVNDAFVAWTNANLARASR